MPRARELLAILVRRSTWQRFVYLGIGVALVAPFATLAGFIAPVLEGGLGETAAWTVASVLCFGPLAMATGMLASVRDLEIAAVPEHAEPPRFCSGSQMPHVGPVCGDGRAPGLHVPDNGKAVRHARLDALLDELARRGDGRGAGREVLAPTVCGFEDVGRRLLLGLGGLGARLLGSCAVLIALLGELAVCIFEADSLGE